MGVEIFGMVAVTSMVTMYAFEDRSPLFVLGFAMSCAAASAYAVMIRSWPFAVVEGIWSVIALQRWFRVRR